MPKTISDLVGSVITHNKYGECHVIEVTDKDSFRFRGQIISTGEIKQFVFSTNFFTVSEEVESAKIKPTIKNQKVVQYKPVDYKKHRNHPLVKEIDRREAGLKAFLKAQNAEEEEAEELSD